MRTVVAAGAALLVLGVASPASADERAFSTGDRRPCFTMGEFEHILTTAVGGRAWTPRAVSQHVEVAGVRSPVNDTPYRVAYTYIGCEADLSFRISYSRVDRTVRVMVWRRA